ncbi:MAG: hypothetical protein EA376_13750 [Phycisphaeraceae bacterium]|nr:MAG: hypothetical protein EA376_13750 [Phycisphaeraceae bacterium]
MRPNPAAAGVGGQGHFFVHERRLARRACRCAKFASLAAAGALVCFVGGCSGGDDAEASSVVQRVRYEIDAEKLPRARELFIRHCAACHGVDGHGDGPAAEFVFPSPRAFDDSPMRFAATGSAEIGERLDAIHTNIAHGVPRSSMVGFTGVLTDDEISLLTRYVRLLTEEKHDGQRRNRRGVAEPPRFTDYLVDRGAHLYRMYACHTCHGETGRGDGPAAIAMVDSMGRPIAPGDLASGVYKSGQRPQDLYRAIVEGVPGTPMIAYGPSFMRADADASDLQDAWALVAYIKTLAKPVGPRGVAAGAELRLQTLADESVFLDPSRVEWLRVETERIMLRPLWHRPDVAPSLDVAFVRAGGRIGVFMHWEDDAPNVRRSVDAFPDQAAVLFALGEEAPALPMGVRIEEHEPEDPVNIWHWKANRQFDASFGAASESPEGRTLEGGAYHLFAMTEDMIRARGPEAPPVLSMRTPHVDRDLMHDDPDFDTASFAGAARNDPRLRAHGALEANALGFGTLQYQPFEEQGVYSSAVWSHGRWFVTMFRDVAPRGGQDIDFAPGNRIPIAFAVWDGERGDRDSLKQISGWHWLVVDGSQ